MDKFFDTKMRDFSDEEFLQSIKQANKNMEETNLNASVRSEDVINELVKYCYRQSKDAGWHNKPREIGTDLMLIVSELAEAMEGARKDLMDDHLPSRKMLEVELADAVIRIFDTAGKYHLDLGGAFVQKMMYNLTRADHKLENREKEGGKQF